MHQTVFVHDIQTSFVNEEINFNNDTLVYYMITCWVHYLCEFKKELLYKIEDLSKEALWDSMNTPLTEKENGVSSIAKITGALLKVKLDLGTIHGAFQIFNILD